MKINRRCFVTTVATGLLAKVLPEQVPKSSLTVDDPNVFLEFEKFRSKVISLLGGDGGVIFFDAWSSGMEKLISEINTNQPITISWADGSSYTFWGILDSITMSMDDPDVVELGIVPTLHDDDGNVQPMICEKGANVVCEGITGSENAYLWTKRKKRK